MIRSFVRGRMPPRLNDNSTFVGVTRSRVRCAEMRQHPRCYCGGGVKLAVSFLSAFAAIGASCTSRAHSRCGCACGARLRGEPSAGVEQGAAVSELLYRRTGGSLSEVLSADSCVAG